MRVRSHRTKTKTAPPAADDAVVAAVDAALGFIAGQPWVRRQTAVAVLEAVRDAARGAGAPQRLYELVDVALEGCDQDRTQAAPLTDALLDIRNSCGVSSSSLARGSQRPREFPDVDAGS
jgi:hypothetical protein